MRLHYLSGDRPAALRAYHRCQATLKRELGVDPLPGTVLLAHEIAQGSDAPHLSQPPRPHLPLAVLRPPVLAGRGGAWKRMERAYAAGQAIFVCGEPGVGKTRLMLDFAGAKGAFTLYEGRPGDNALDFATLARLFRRVLAAEPSLARALPVWVRRRLAVLLPDAFPDVSPTPLDADRAGFFEAAVTFYTLFSRDQVALVADDLHLFDPASLELRAYFVNRYADAAWPTPARLITGFRAGERSPEADATVRQFVDADRAVLIELGPLSEDGVEQLVSGLSLAVSPSAGSLWRYTGGNPLFVLETLKTLIETGRIAPDLPAHLPPPERIGTLIERRLERLSGAARGLLQVVALSDRDFDYARAEAVFERDALTLSSAWTGRQSRPLSAPSP